MDQSNRTIVVTGAAHGIGRAIALRMIGDGDFVVALDVDFSALQALVAEVGSERIMAIEVDISVRQEVDAAMARAMAWRNRLDVLVANAGVAESEPFLDIEERSWRRIIDVNLNGTFFCAQAAGRIMSRNGGGAIVVTSSTNAWFVESNLAHYNTSKGGVGALVRSAALDLARYGVRVNAVEPSMVRTRAAFLTHDPVASANYLQKVPLGRFAEASEVADAVVFLASDQSSYITGQSIVLDGGLTLGVEIPLQAGTPRKSTRAADHDV